MALSNKQTNYHFHYSILVNNTQEKVWNFLTNVERWKEWDTALQSSTLSEHFGLGAKGILIPKKGPKLTFYISKIIPDTSYTFVTKMPVGTLEIKRTLKNKANQIEFTDDIRFTGFLKRVFGLMLGGGFKKVLPEVMQNFKELAEQE
ncbi:polyketide cyclase [Aggregatimonas sangjinii]|uniref:Polyketide cyclase n=1 Tax=Aggregatimonas sangjinii TaxID=2583587 RepID=A0A5B7SPP5_9FLAO|nr:SRPBCC family protein [Aggregatimonas sangjinii]QCW98989.1 polyketide cyclase [Aggregatimonas sangjinii]